MRACVFVLIGLLQAFAFGSGPVRRDHVEAELIASTTSLRPGEPLLAAVRLKMDEHWHTYWRNPGESGLATTIAWELPEGFTAGEIQWPAPHRIVLGGIANYAFEGQILLPVQIATPATAGGNVILTAHVKWLGCSEACIPGQADLTLTLPASAQPPEKDPRWAALFDEAAKRSPARIDSSRVAATRKGESIQLTIKDVPAVEPVYFFPLEADLVPGEIRQTAEAVTIALKPSVYAGGPIQRIRGVLRAGQQAWEIDAPLGATAVTPGASSSGGGGGEAEPPLLGLLLAAFLGGLLLNLMPCVFPVLSIKILGFVNQADEDPRRVLRHGLVFGAGVLVSIWALTALLLALRAGGEKLGWGFQLQEPRFVVLMTVLMFLVGLSFIDVFGFGIGLMNLAGHAHGHIQGGYGGSFFSGVLAVAIATPCTAPFLGPAIGVGLSLPAMKAIAVFTMLAIGMALPYVFLSAFPRWLEALPRPGPWMETFKQVMAFPMFAATIWLAWVFGQQVGGANGMLFLLMGLLAVGIGAWVYGRWHRLPAKCAAVLLMAGGIAIPILAVGPLTNSGTLTWQVWSEAAVAESRAAGRPVFVDFTADWCLTCKFNENTVLSQRNVVEAFARSDVVLLKADWTRRDARITEALSRFDRAGVPLYVVYPPDGAAQPTVLPTVLTGAIVVEAVNKVSQGRLGRSR